MRRPLLLLTIGAALVCPTLAWGQPRRAASEGQIKAAFIVGFMRFVQWAPSSTASTRSALVVCVMEDTPVLDALAATNGLTAQNRAVRVRRVSQTEELTPCDVLHIGKAASDSRVVARALQLKNVLTVTDAATGPDAVIQFVPDGDRLTFAVNLDAARAAGLEVSSQLLSVAQHITGAPTTRP